MKECGKAVMSLFLCKGFYVEASMYGDTRTDTGSDVTTDIEVPKK